MNTTERRKAYGLLPLLAALIAVAVLLLPQQAHASSHDITGFSATAGSANNATLRWTAPSRSGITVTRYEIYWTPSSARDWYQEFDPGGRLTHGSVAKQAFVYPLRGSAWLGGSATSYTVTGLNGGMDYDFMIQAWGSGFDDIANGMVIDQNGDRGVYHFAEDVSIAGPPHPFSSIDITVDRSHRYPGFTETKAEWWLPHSTEIGTSLTKAQLQYKRGDHSNWITAANYTNYATGFSGFTTPVVYEIANSIIWDANLDPGRAYDFRVRAGNSDGWSNWTQASVTVPANFPTDVTVSSSGRLREGSGPATVTFTLDQPAHRELSPVEAYVVLGEDRVNVSIPTFAKGSRTATATITPINDNISNPCGSVAIKYLFPGELRTTVSFTIIDNDTSRNPCTGRIGDGTPSALTLERVGRVEGGQTPFVEVLAKLNRPAMDMRIVNVAVDGSSTATEDDDYLVGDSRLFIHRGDVNAKWTNDRGIHDWPTLIAITEDASNNETIMLRATSGSLTSNALTLNVGQLRRQAARQGSPDEAARPTAVTLALGDGNDAAAEKTVGEDAGDVTVTATLDAPAPHGGITLRLFPGPEDTATRDADYTMPEAITIPAGERSGSGTVRVTDDALDESDESANITAFAALLDGDLAGSADLTITDDDTAGVTISAASPLEVDEGGNATYTVALDSQPTADVTITASSSDNEAATVSPASHTFTSSSWNTAATFTSAACQTPTPTTSQWPSATV